MSASRSAENVSRSPQTLPLNLFTGQIKSSSDLVPGDTISLLSPGLHTVPADILLLSGDAIVNESMLTGESVPVSKIPATEAAIRGYVSVSRPHIT